MLLHRAKLIYALESVLLLLTCYHPHSVYDPYYFRCCRRVWGGVSVLADFDGFLQVCSCHLERISEATTSIHFH